MSTTEEEMNDKLDELEQDVEQDVEKTDGQNDGKTTNDTEKSPGYITYDEWEAQGKDPADFKGENAYKAEYERIKEIRDLKGTMNQVVQGMESWKVEQNELKSQEIEEARNQAVLDLAKAKEAEDMDAYTEATDKITTLDKRVEKQPLQINPVITDFVSKNPIIDSNNAQYDAEFHQDMRMIHNGKLDQLLGGDRSRANELTQSQIERVQTLAFNQAKELHADKFKSSKNTRQTTTTTTHRTSSKVDPASKIKDFKIDRNNPRDTNPAKEMYEYLKERDPAAAETFAKNVIGE